MNFDQQKTTSITNTSAGRHERQADPAAAEHDDRELHRRQRRHQRRARRDTGRPRARRPATQNYSKTSNQANNALDQVDKDVQQAPGQDQPPLGRGAARQLGREAGRRRQLDQADPGRRRLQPDARRRRAGARRCRSAPTRRRRPRQQLKAAIGLELELDERHGPHHRDAGDHRAWCCSSPGGRSSGPRPTGFRCECRSTCASSKPPTPALWRRRRDAPTLGSRAPSARTRRRHRRRGRAHRSHRTPARRSGTDAAFVAR